MVSLFLAQVLLFSIFPVYFTFLKSPIRRVSFYVYIALVLLIGGFFGNVYTLPLTDSINVSGGNLCYGAFMMASVLFVLAEQDAFVLRHLVRLVVFVDLFNVLFSVLVSTMLSMPGVINPHHVAAGLFDVSIPFIVLGGVLIISELFFLFFCFEKIKARRWPFMVTALFYVILFIIVLCSDGVLFPLIAFGLSSQVIAIVIGGFIGKVIMASAFSLPLMCFILMKQRSFANYLNSDGVKWSLIFSTSSQIMRELSAKDYGLKQAETVFRGTNEGLAVVDKHGRILKANPAFSAMVGVAADLQSGRFSIDTLFFPVEGKQKVSDVRGRWRGEIVFGLNSIHKGLLSIMPVESESQHEETYIYSLVNIDELKQAQENLSYLARHDPLTGLANRRVLDDLLAQLPSDTVSLIVVDLDHFKDVNDSYGHGAGDRVLKEVGKRIHSIIAEMPDLNGQLCRTGGDEFAVLIESANKEHIDTLCQKIQDVFKLVITLPENSEIYVSATLGVSRQSSHQHCDLLHEADSALYAAKDQQRGSIGYYKEQLTQDRQRKLLLHGKLKKALEGELLSVFYQPQYHSKTHKIVGVEALARWHDDELGWVSPAEFIPVAEATGLVEKLGEWVLLQACDQGRIWVNQGFSDLKISVNVSAHQLRFGQFVDIVKMVLAQSKLPASALQLELTESAFIEREQEVIPQLSALKLLGVQLAIDDFGTGYSSLSYVASLPWDTLKIDRSFIDRLPEDRAQRQITDTIIQLAENMSLTVIVEGVETQAQLTYLTERGCHMIQGFFFSPAIEASAMTKKLTV